MNPNRRAKRFPDQVKALLEDLKQGSDPGLRHFAKILEWEILFFDRVAKTARRSGLSALKKMFRDEGSPFQIGEQDVYGGGEDRWYYYFWAALYPEKFALNIKGGIKEPGYVLKSEESIGERERTILLGLLTSSLGRSFLFDKVIEQIRGRFGNRPPWSEKYADQLRNLFGILSACPQCGMPFVGNRKGQKYCADICRKRDHAVPLFKRKDPAPYMFFYRKVKEGCTHKEAWNLTIERHEERLKAIGQNGQEPPLGWAVKFWY